MAILINASNIKAGGGLQVADSVCRQLNRFNDLAIVVVISSCLKNIANIISDYPNVNLIIYDMPHTCRLYLTGRDTLLDNIVEKYDVEKVLTIFGPSIWIPKVPHLCGFASGQLTPQDSPFYSLKWPFRYRIHEWFRNKCLYYYYKKCSNYLWTENESVSNALRVLFPNKKVFTVTNYYNQIYDYPETWKSHRLPTFDGVTLLTVTNIYPHKNLCIALEIALTLEETHPEFHFRFVMTVTEDDFITALGDYNPHIVSSEKLISIYSQLRHHFLFVGTVGIDECPSLYEQCDIEFQPSLLECFTATFPEAMRMGKPIVTTDLAYAHGLCGDAAIYYSPLSAEDAAEKIHMLSSDSSLIKELVEKGKRQILTFDNYEQRADKLIRLLETVGS